MEPSSASAVPVVSNVSSVDAGMIINTWHHLVVTAESGKEEGMSMPKTKCKVKMWLWLLKYRIEKERALKVVLKLWMCA